MGKTIKFSQKSVRAKNEQEHDDVILEQHEWLQHKRSAKASENQKKSKKAMRGHFDQQHVWPITLEKRKGRKI